MNKELLFLLTKRVLVIWDSTNQSSLIKIIKLFYIFKNKHITEIVTENVNLFHWIRSVGFHPPTNETNTEILEIQRNPAQSECLIVYHLLGIEIFGFWSILFPLTIARTHTHTHKRRLSHFVELYCSTEKANN